jgi:hypothetical protein
MIMNKKIFTLLVGACILISSLFTVNAQRRFPYSVKTKADTTNFYDLLTADPLDKLPAKSVKGQTGSYFYLLGVTGLVNETLAKASELSRDLKDARKSYVMYADSTIIGGEGIMDTAYLRIETLAKLDTAYGFEFYGSHKFGAIRRASWCLDYELVGEGSVQGSNVYYYFSNMHTGTKLGAPPRGDDPNWQRDPVDNRMVYNKYYSALNIIDTNRFDADRWHFSQTYLPTQKLQANMPLYTYISKDTVAVLVLADTVVNPNASQKPLSGGYYVTVKKVAIGDLIDNSSGRTVIREGVPNVLLFTLKKVNRFVMNADDWNAINRSEKAEHITFIEDADTKAKNDRTENEYKNPFEDFGSLRAYEVNDSLYHYGYMQFQRKNNPSNRGRFLYVDTAWANTGSIKYLAFEWGKKRNGKKRVSGLDASSATANIGDTLFWGGEFIPLLVGKDKGYVPQWADYVGDDITKFRIDSVNYALAYMKDSLMENQSKFRVVYDPFVDSTFINVYQSRVRYYDEEQKKWPAWWANSFWIDPTDSSFVFPFSDKGALSYYKDTVQFIPMVHTGSRRSDVSSMSSGYEGHGITTKGGFHSLMGFIRTSSSSDMDSVMVSTADTVPIYLKFAELKDSSALSHMYGWSLTETSELKYKDSLLYIDLQDLGGKKIITLDQSYTNKNKGLDTRISLDFGPRCEFVPKVVEPEQPPKEYEYIQSDLCLIRNTVGEYLCVPLWSISDSVYWVTPAPGEDPTRIPSYQWAIIGCNSSSDCELTFKMVNREFENVKYDYVKLQSRTAGPKRFNFNGSSSNVYNKEVYNRFSRDSIGWDDVDANDFVGSLEKRYPLSGGVCFIRLNDKVKKDQLLGYKHIDRDSTIIDVYAFKYFNALAMGDNARYLSWDGYEETSDDSTVWAKGKNEFDKLFFELQEMTLDEIGRMDGKAGGDNLQGGIELTSRTIAREHGFEDVYDRLTKKPHTYINPGSIVLERFGFYESALPGELGKLKPLARQAYRLFLKDYYYWYPTIKGHYMVPGQIDRYILADRAYAAGKYVQDETNRVEGLFGIPHFYFRNTYFDIEKKGDDYFAMIQRLDTIGNEQYGGAPYDDVEEYLLKRFGPLVAGKIKSKIVSNKELGLFAVQVDDGTGKVIYSVRGESAVAVSTYQLSRDQDPIYRRLHVNEPVGEFYPDRQDNPDTLEFHIMNDPDMKLYENSGHYKAMTEPINDPAAKRGPCGGRIYNLDDNGYYKKDSLNKVISFLGIRGQYQHDTVKENYAFYVDTAYIGRGTGWIKPQYMLVVDPYFPWQNEHSGGAIDCDPRDGKELFNGPSPNPHYVIGRYLFNTAMYAKSVADTVRGRNYELIRADAQHNGNGPFLYSRNNYNKVQPINVNDRNKPNGVAYKHRIDWERLAFAWAIHKGDSLYVLKGVEPLFVENVPNDAEALWKKLMDEYKSVKPASIYEQPYYLDLSKLIESNVIGGAYSELYYPNGDRGEDEARQYNNYKTMDQVRADGRTIGLQAVINLSDNTHKDWVFSFRYIERDANEFVIESETTDRNTAVGAMIRPGYGGWVKSDNGVPVITRSDSKKLMSEAAIFNVKRPTEAGYTAPVGNEEVTTASAVAVIGGTGNVTILNAAGKNVVISNLLGQTVVNAKITSDKAVFAAPAGFVVVAVEGENTVKALVK